MKTINLRWKQATLGAVSLIFGLGLISTPTQAAPLVTSVGVDLASGPFTFSYLGSSFSLTGTGGFPNYLAVSTSSDAAVRTVFGSPSTDFTDRGTVIYDQNILGGYGSFPSLTTIPFTNGNNFLGLRVTSGSQNYYGFLFTTNSVLNSYGFETAANTGINPVTALAGAVPEPASWVLMIGGLGLVGGMLRRRKGAMLAAA